MPDPHRIAAAYVEHVCRDDGDDPHAPWHWSDQCMFNLVQHAPLLAWDVVVAATDLVSTPSEAGMLAASGLEDLISYHGELVIERIEEKARRSPRFRYILTGVWPQGKSGTEVWMRVEAARQGSGNPDTDPLPES